MRTLLLVAALAAVAALLPGCAPGLRAHSQCAPEEEVAANPQMAVTRAIWGKKSKEECEAGVGPPVEEKLIYNLLGGGEKK